MSRNLATSIKDRIRADTKIREKRINDIWKALVLERFMVRLAASNQAQKLILKGGMLLSKYIPLDRYTKDLDFLAINLPGTFATMDMVMREVCAIELSDGFSFTNIKVKKIKHDHMKYPGFAIQATACLGDTKTIMEMDIGIGDAVDVEMRELPLMSLNNRPVFEQSVAMYVYPIEYIFAEKLEAAVTRGASNSRAKDFYDLWLLLKLDPPIELSRLIPAIAATFSNRMTTLQPLAQLVGDINSTPAKKWIDFHNALPESAKRNLPGDFFEIVKEVDDWLVRESVIQKVETASAHVDS